MRAQGGEIVCAVYVDARHERGFGSACERKVDVGHAGSVGNGGCVLSRSTADHREGAPHRPERAGQRELAREFAVCKRFSRNLPARGQDAERDGQVEAPRLLRQIGGRKIDGDTAHGEIEAAVLQRGAHALAAFADFEIGQADY